MLPLYDNLFRSTEDIDLTATQKNTLVKNVKKMDQLGYDMIYVFVRLYEDSTSEFPYECKFSKADLKLDVDKLPNKLKQILFKFSTLHLSKMEEDVRLSVERT